MWFWVIIEVVKGLAKKPSLSKNHSWSKKVTVNTYIVQSWWNFHRFWPSFVVTICEIFMKITQCMCSQWPFYFRCDISKHDGFLADPLWNNKSGLFSCPKRFADLKFFDYLKSLGHYEQLSFWYLSWKVAIWHIDIPVPPSEANRGT